MPFRSSHSVRSPRAIKDHVSKVLIVEDSPDCLQPLKRLLQLAGHEVACARDGVEALTLVRSFRPDKLVTDLSMPGMDGVGLIEAIRRDRSLAHLPVIVYTAGSDPHTDLRLKALGVAAIHSKGAVDVQALLRSVQAVGGNEPPAFSSPFSAG